MAETLLADVFLLVAHMTAGGNSWAQTIHYHRTDGSVPIGDESAITGFTDFCKRNTPNSGFVESVSGYRTYQRHIGDLSVEHPPLFTNNLHVSGTHDANYNGAPLGAPLPKDVCVFAKCGTSGGRAGKLFVRNLLEEQEVESVLSGKWVFSPGSSRFTTTRFSTVVTNSLAPVLPGGANYSAEQLVVAHLLHVKATDVRAPYFTPITTITAIRPVWNRADR